MVYHTEHWRNGAYTNFWSTLGMTKSTDEGLQLDDPFQPGVRDIGYWQVPNNVAQVHLCGGAVVYGAMHAPTVRARGSRSATVHCRTSRTSAWFFIERYCGPEVVTA